MAKELITRYEKQQDNVKNNREYDALSKEIELQKLEIQLSDKKANDATALKGAKEAIIEDTQKIIKERDKNLKAKKKRTRKNYRGNRERRERTSKRKRQAS